MKERPILFSAPMVRALLADTKTQTRRVVKSIELARGEARGVRVAPNTFCYLDFDGVPGLSWRPFGGSQTVPYPPEKVAAACPYGERGDQLWVKETFAPCAAPALKGHVHYRADGAVGLRQQTNGGDSWWARSGHTLGLAEKTLHGVWVGPPKKWKPSIFMTRKASRITLEVTGVRVERLQAISETDAMAEGIACTNEHRWGLAATGREHNAPTHAFRALWESINGADSWAANPWVWVVEFKRVTK